MPSLEMYKRSLDYSYAPGMFPTVEAVTKRPEWVRKVLLSSQAEGEGAEKIRALCAERGIRIEEADKALSRISGKDNCYSAAVFEKEQSPLMPGRHIVLHHISDSGNLGTILRSALAFGYHDIAVINPAADPFDPRTVRASMGALFSLRLSTYSDFESYRTGFASQKLFPFMLTGSVLPETACRERTEQFSLIMGNEGSGLPEEFAAMGTPVRIPQSDEVDSLNLSIAASIGMYLFSR